MHPILCLLFFAAGFGAFLLDPEIAPAASWLDMVAPTNDGIRLDAGPVDGRVTLDSGPLPPGSRAGLSVSAGKARIQISRKGALDLAPATLGGTDPLAGFDLLSRSLRGVTGSGFHLSHDTTSVGVVVMDGSERPGDRAGLDTAVAARHRQGWVSGSLTAGRLDDRDLAQFRFAGRIGADTEVSTGVQLTRKAGRTEVRNALVLDHAEWLAAGDSLVVRLEPGWTSGDGDVSAYRGSLAYRFSAPLGKLSLRSQTDTRDKSLSFGLDWRLNW